MVRRRPTPTEGTDLTRGGGKRSKINVEVPYDGAWDPPSDAGGDAYTAAADPDVADDATDATEVGAVDVDEAELPDVNTSARAAGEAEPKTPVPRVGAPGVAAGPADPSPPDETRGVLGGETVCAGQSPCQKAR